MAGGGGENDASNKGKESAIETMRTFERDSEQGAGREGSQRTESSNSG